MGLTGILKYQVKKDHEFCLKYRSAKVITLLWIQETCYNKKWDGEAWIQAED